MKKRVMAYRVIIGVLLLFLTVFSFVSVHNFNELTLVNEDLQKTIEEQREGQKANNEKWKDTYNKLQGKYCSLLKENESLKGVTITDYKFSIEEIYLIAQVVEAEAGNEKQSQQYVCQVIINRLKSGKFPNTVADIIYQKYNEVPQFSVAYNGMIDDREVTFETLVNVYSTICHGTDLPEYVLYFYSSEVTENWVNTLNVYTTVNGTVFAYDEDY